MSMYRPYSNISFNNCYDFITKAKAEKEVWELSTSLTFDDEEEMRWELDRISDLARDIMNAEYDLCEMEMDALYDAMQYDSVFKGNAFRSSKRAQRRKQNKKNKVRDRIHGRRHSGAHGGIDFRYIDCNPYCNKHRYHDAMFVINGKHHHNANRKTSAMDMREKDYNSTIKEKYALIDSLRDNLNEQIDLKKEILNKEAEISKTSVWNKGFNNLCESVISSKEKLKELEREEEVLTSILLVN